MTTLYLSLSLYRNLYICLSPAPDAIVAAIAASKGPISSYSSSNTRGELEVDELLRISMQVSL
jgi:hypothetical protein